MATLKIKNTEGQWEYIQLAGPDAFEAISQGKTPPVLKQDGKLWLDTGDNNYQGTIFETLQNQVDSLAAKEYFKMFDGFIGNESYYKQTEFDTPTSGNITESIKLTADNSVFATKITRFNTPTSGDITETVVIASEGINVRKITKFDTPVVGNIKESYEVIV